MTIASALTWSGIVNALPKRRRAAGLAISLVVHAGLALLVLGSAGGALITGGAGDPYGDEGAIEVSLSGRVGGAGATKGDPTAETLADLLARIRTTPSDLTASEKPNQTKGNIDKLFQAIDEQRMSARQTGANGQAKLDFGGHGDASGSDSSIASHAARGAHAKSEGPGQVDSAGDLWGQIKPCWDELPRVSAVPVTLRIVLDDRGQIAKPPEILRPSEGRPDERRLISEARALAALAACVPYHSAGGWDSKQTFEIKFVQGQ